MLNVNELVAKHYSINPLSFNLWFFITTKDAYYDNGIYRINRNNNEIIEFPENVIKNYEHAKLERTRIIYNFYTDEYYLLCYFKIENNLKANLNIVDIYSIHLQKQVASFVTDSECIEQYNNILRFIYDNTKAAKYIYLLSGDKLIRFKNPNSRLIKSIYGMNLFIFSSIPIIAYSSYSDKHEFKIIHNMLEANFKILPLDFYVETHNTAYIKGIVNKYMLYLNPLDFRVYLQKTSKVNSQYNECLKVLI